MKYRKKPVVIEAIQWTGENWSEISEFVGADASWDGGQLVIKTLEGQHIATKSDYIIRGVEGEHYPCKPGIFEQTYDIVEDEDFLAGDYNTNTRPYRS